MVERKEGKGGCVSFIYVDGDVVARKGEPNGFWEYGGCYLATVVWVLLSPM